MKVRHLTDSIHIDASPEAVWAWLLDLAGHYPQWHPDHVSARWERGEPNRVGSVMRAVEYLAGRREVLRFQMTSIDPPTGFAYRMRGPVSMLLPGGGFEVAPDGGGARFTATISYRFGRLTERLFRHRTAALQQHMREEGENLKRIIETASRTAAPSPPVGPAERGGEGRRVGRRMRVPPALRRAARRELTPRLGREGAGLVIRRAQSVYPKLAARIPRTRAGARHLLRISAYALALHEALGEQGFEPGPAGRLVSDAVFASIKRPRDLLQACARLRHRDPLRRARWAARVARRLYYTDPDWRMETVETDDVFGLDVTRCVVAEYFASLGKSDLCGPLICEQDLRIATRHGIRLERSGTLAGGADRCDFRYRLPAA